jgi:hypothetical protein
MPFGVVPKVVDANQSSPLLKLVHPCGNQAGPLNPNPVTYIRRKFTKILFIQLRQLTKLKKVVKLLTSLTQSSIHSLIKIASIDTTIRDFQASRNRYKDHKYWGVTFKSKQFLLHPILSPYDSPIPSHVPTPSFEHPSSALLSVPPSTQPEAVLVR